MGGEGAFQALDLPVDVGIREQAIREPKREAVDQHRRSRRQRAKRPSEIVRRFDCLPALITAGAMLGDAALHLIVARLRRGEIDPGAGLAFDELLSVAALAGTGAADDEVQFTPRPRLHEVPSLSARGLSVPGKGPRARRARARTGAWSAPRQRRSCDASLRGSATRSSPAAARR